MTDIYPGFEPVDGMTVLKTGPETVRIEVDAGATPDQVEIVKAAIRRSHPMWGIEVTATYHASLEVCPSCRNWMLYKLPSAKELWRYEGQARIQRYGGYLDDRVVCGQCLEDYYQQNFTCDHCDKDWPKSEVKFKYTMRGTGYLCQTCYSTLTAAEWDEAIEDIERDYAYSD